MNRVWTGVLSVLVLLAIAKVLVAQPTEEALLNGLTPPIVTEDNQVITDEFMGEGVMEMNEEMPPVEDENTGY